MNLLKQNFDIVFLLLGIALYAFQAAFFPVLLLAFVFLWYRRELLWRVKHGKAGHPNGPFYLNARVNGFVYPFFWFFGIVWILGYGITMIVLNKTFLSEYMVIYNAWERKLFTELFDTTLRYIHIGHANSEPEIAQTLINTLAQSEPIGNSWQTGNVANLMGSDKVQWRIYGLRGLLGLLFIYILLFGRIFIIQPFYVYLSNQQQPRFKWRNIRILYVVVFLLLCWMFFYLPIHREDCPIGRSGMWCSNLGGERLKYIAFPARIMLYWTVMLFFINNFLNDVLNKENQNNMKNTPNHHT